MPNTSTYSTLPLSARAEIRANAMQQKHDSCQDARSERNDADEELACALQDGLEALRAGDVEGAREAMQRACQYRAAYMFWAAEYERCCARV